MALGAVRLVVGGAALFLLAFARGVLRQDRPWPKGATIFAAAAVAVYQLFFFAGIARTGVAVGTVVAIGSSPILAGLMGSIIRGERPTRRWLTATLLAVSGCSLLVAAGSSLSVDVTGVMLALGAGLAYATYSVASKGLLESHSPDAVTAVVFSLGALFVVPLFFTADFSWLAQPCGLIAALHLGLIATAGAYTLFTRGLRLVPVATAVSLSLTEPLTAGLLGVFLLGEQLTPLAWLGILLLLAGLMLLTVYSVKQGAAAHPTHPQTHPTA